MTKRYWGAGPPQIWQINIIQWPGDVPPIVRLERTGLKGLPVGPGNTCMGGLYVNVAERLELYRDAILERDESGKIIRAYATQLSFIF